MYVASGIVAQGAPLLTLDLVTVRKDIQLPGQTVDSYKSKSVSAPDRILERRINVVTIGPLVVDAIRPHVNRAELQRAMSRIFLHLLAFTYPFWISYYRRI